MRLLKRIPLLSFFTTYAFSKFRSVLYSKIIVKEINGITYELDLSENIDFSLFFMVITKKIRRKYYVNTSDQI